MRGAPHVVASPSAASTTPPRDHDLLSAEESLNPVMPSAPMVSVEAMGIVGLSRMDMGMGMRLPGDPADPAAYQIPGPLLDLACGPPGPEMANPHHVGGVVRVDHLSGTPLHEAAERDPEAGTLTPTPTTATAASSLTCLEAPQVMMTTVKGKASLGGQASSGSRRGRYKCSKCGMPKKGHVCPFGPNVKDNKCRTGTIQHNSNSNNNNSSSSNIINSSISSSGSGGKPSSGGKHHPPGGGPHAGGGLVGAHNGNNGVAPVTPLQPPPRPSLRFTLAHGRSINFSFN
mmetsp:Transcript_21439/g.45052  ORF Transcript_21439/g.45052 Transcript_21439/m.45052 type:complete len:287 (-) Transcript_21439:69-929(-)